jgi:hypothetical protein
MAPETRDVITRVFQEVYTMPTLRMHAWGKLSPVDTPLTLSDTTGSDIRRMVDIIKKEVAKR